MRKFQRQLNPAFATAHGLAVPEEAVADRDRRQERSSNASSSSRRLELAVKQAQSGGKLNLVNMGLTMPLPEAVFDFRLSLSSQQAVDLSMDRQPRRQQSLNYIEETVTAVDVSDNPSLTGVMDPRFVQFAQTQSLRFKQCGWSHVDLSLQSLEHLFILDLSGNQLQTFDLSLLPTSLQELHLEGNSLKLLHAAATDDDNKAIIDFPHLTLLDLSNNQISDFGACNHLSCPHLKTFQCPHNSIQGAAFPPSFLETAHASLQTLDASYNQLGEGNDNSSFNFSKYTQLSSLNLAVNKLHSIPTIPLSLQRLDVTSNKIPNIQNLLSQPQETSAPPPSLVYLILQDNHLNELNAGLIKQCTNLQRLDLSANMLKTLPYQLGLLPNIQTVRLSGNPLYTFKTSDLDHPTGAPVLEVLRRRAPKDESSTATPSRSSNNMLPSTLFQNHSIALAKSISSGVSHYPRRHHHPDDSTFSALDLNQLVHELQSRPKTAEGITQKLSLDNNGFDSIPEELFPLLPNVIHISMSGNCLKTLTMSLARSCSKLERLDVSRNSLSSISSSLPPPLAWYHSLKHLDLSCNRLVEFPMDIISQLMVLETLNLATNKLQAIDRCTKFPPTLMHLLLAENAISDIDSLVWRLGAGGCPKLQTLWLARNDITKIPPILGLLLSEHTSLTSLDLRGNPQQAIRQDVLERSCKDQLSYLKNRLTAEQIDAARRQVLALQQQPQTKNDDGDIRRITIALKNNDDDSSNPTNSAEDESSSLSPLLIELQTIIQKLQEEVDDPSLSQAKRYAVKKSLAMERSKLIREERKLGLRK